MKQSLILILSLAFFAGCLGTHTTSATGEAASPSKSENKTFAQHYEELEQQPVPSREELAAMPNNLLSEEDRAAEVAAQAQAERRGEAPLLESNYIFKVKQNKGVYSYDQHNQVWKDERSSREYKENKRLWEKPKKYAAATYYGEGSSSSEEYSYSED